MYLRKPPTAPYLVEMSSFKNCAQHMCETDAVLVSGQLQFSAEADNPSEEGERGASLLVSRRLTHLYSLTPEALVL